MANSAETIAQRILGELANRLGIPREVAAAAAGTVFQFLSHQLEAGSFDALLERFPPARAWLTEALRTQDRAERNNPMGSLLGEVASLAGGLGGGAGTAAQLFARLGQVGVPADRLADFVPTFSRLLGENLPDDLMQVIGRALDEPASGRP